MLVMFFYKVLENEFYRNIIIQNVAKTIIYWNNKYIHENFILLSHDLITFFF
jgi:hypothetical protein